MDSEQEFAGNSSRSKSKIDGSISKKHLTPAARSDSKSGLRRRPPAMRGG